jgi:anthraniloyl-CoA monooxygenase
VFVEMTDISREGRISPGCAGMYQPEHAVAWKRIVDFVHANSGAKIAMQLGHAGRKASTQRMWEGMDEPLPEGNWPIISASPLPYFPHSQVPKEMTRTDMDQVKRDFVRAAELSEAAGFDLLELHFAHGYLLASFISPSITKRTINTAAHSRTACGFRWKCSTRFAKCGRHTSRCRCVSRRSIGILRACSRLMPSRSRAC